MKFLTTILIVGLHLPPMLMAFTSSIRTERVSQMAIFAMKPTPPSLGDRRTSNIPSTITSDYFGKKDQNDSTSVTSNGTSRQIVRNSALAVAFFLAGTMIPLVAFGVSGGGLDYANLDITGQDFSGGNYKGKDFTQVIAKATNFAGSNLQGCRFYKAYLVRTDFSGADLRGASLEDTSMDEASLRNAIASGAYFSNSIIDTKDLENADFTDAQFPSKTLSLLCQRDDVKGTNPTTGVDTRESLMCP